MKKKENSRKKRRIGFFCMCYSESGGESNGIVFFGIFRLLLLRQFSVESFDWIDDEENVNELRLLDTIDCFGVIGIVNDPVDDGFCSDSDPFLVTGKKDRKLQTKQINKPYTKQSKIVIEFLLVKRNALGLYVSISYMSIAGLRVIEDNL